MTVTASSFKALKTQFSTVDDDVVEYYLGLAGLWVGTDWPSSIVDHATVAATCHLMTLEGLGTDAQSELFAGGLTDVQSFKSGTLSLTRFQRQNTDSDFKSWLSSTTCGQFFWQLLKMRYGGPVVARGGVSSDSASYAARDWPLAFYQV